MISIPGYVLCQWVLRWYELVSMSHYSHIFGMIPLPGYACHNCPVCQGHQNRDSCSPACYSQPTLNGKQFFTLHLIFLRFQQTSVCIFEPVLSDFDSFYSCLNRLVILTTDLIPSNFAILYTFLRTFWDHSHPVPFFLFWSLLFGSCFSFSALLHIFQLHPLLKVLLFSNVYRVCKKANSNRVDNVYFYASH